MEGSAEKESGDVRVSRLSRDRSNANVKVEGVVEFATRDDHEMALVGKKQQLRRNFGFMSILGVSCTLMATWEGLLCVFVYGLGNGGPAGLVYGFLFCWLGYLAVCGSLAELVSMAPTAGGQYHWTYLFAPPGWRNFLSYITGWQTVIAWQASSASSSFVAGTIVQGLLVLIYPNYVFERYHGTLLLYAAMAVSVLFNTLLARYLPVIESAVLVLHIVGFFAILLPLTIMASHGSAHDVFALFTNAGGFDTQGLSIFVGLITSVFAFLGVDGAVHMVEEIKDASTVVPQSMMIGIMVNGVLGFAMLLALLFCIGNVDDALNTPTKFPFIEIFAQATGSHGGAVGMTTLVLFLIIFATIVTVTATSRMTWAFARDKGLPGSGIIGRVEPRTKLPLYSIGLNAAITILLGLINIGSTEAFNALVSLVVAGVLGSYIPPIGLLFWKRLRGDDIRYGPWRLGKFGVVTNAFALVWTVIALFFSFWPGAMNPTAKTMNWACLLYGATMIFAVSFYAVYGRHHYNGPIIETSVIEHLRGA